MPMLIKDPTKIQAAGNQDKMIEKEIIAFIRSGNPRMTSEIVSFR